MSVEGSSDFVSSMELWGAGKIIGRECSEINLDFCLCKKFKGEEPKECADLAKKVQACTKKVVGEIRDTFPDEFSKYTTCLDKKDYQIPKCRPQERALLDCWNSKMGYSQE